MFIKFLNGYILSFNFISCIILILAPTIFNWNPVIDSTDLDRLPISNALKSVDFKIILYVSLAVSSPMVLQLIFRICVDPTILFSFYKGISNIILVIWIIATDVLILSIVIPHNNVMIYCAISHLRLILLSWSAGIYLYLYSESNIWQSQLTVGAFIGINSTRVIRYYEIYYKISHRLLLANSVVLGICYVTVLLQCIRWFYNVRKKYKTRPMSSRESYCGVYIASTFGVLICAIYIIGYFYNTAFWYQATSSYLCAQTMVYTVFYLIFSVFQENAFEREAQSSKLALEVKQMFIRYMSHEMRTPLNTVMMGLQHLQEEIAALPNSGSSSCCCNNNITNQLVVIEEIKESCGIALQTLNDMLLHDKIETGCLVIETENVKIIPLVQGVVRELQLQARQLGVEMSVSFLDNDANNNNNNNNLLSTSDWDNLTVSGDSRKLAQVFRNIISNALKFSPRNGSVSLRIRKVPDSMFDIRSIKIEIVDSGVGISLVNQSKLFHGIIQFNPGELQAGGGAGLGLYISKGIVDAHKGGLTVTSEGEGMGSTFTVTLPLVSTMIATTTDTILQFMSTRHASRTTTTVAAAVVAVARAASSGSASIHPMVGSLGSMSQLPVAAPATEAQTPIGDNDTHQMGNSIAVTPSVAIDNIIPSWDNLSSNSNSNTSAKNIERNQKKDKVEDEKVGDASDLLGGISLLSGMIPVVLVVDDVSSNRKMLKRLLVGRCSCAIEAVDGQEAVEKVREAMSTGTPIDVITIDYQMPVMDGPTATRKIRDLGYTGIILGVTGNVLKDDIEKFLAAGANRVLTKPLNMAVFDETVAELFAGN